MNQVCYYKLLIILALSLVGHLSFAGSYHTGNLLICSDCHTMHYSQNGIAPSEAEPGGPFSDMLLASSSTALCLSCHDGSVAAAADVVAPVTMYSQAGVGYSAGGFFESSIGTNSDKGHDLGVAIGQVPLSTMSNVILSCTSCHNPHGNKNYRNLLTKPGTGKGTKIITGVDVFEKFPSKMPPTRSSVIAEYRASNIGYKSNMSKWCMECHDLLSRNVKGGSPSHFMQHPIDISIGFATYRGKSTNASSRRVAASHWIDGKGEGFGLRTKRKFKSVPRVRFQTPGAGNYASAKRVSPNNQIFCGTCHLAHGSAYHAAVVWPHKSPGPDSYSVCQQCHTTYEYYSSSPHANVNYGAYRNTKAPRGSCSQCHLIHSEGKGNDSLLFERNSTDICFSTNCHTEDPPTTYPASENDRMPFSLSGDRAGYFERNSGGVKIWGTDNRSRWPGETVYTDTGSINGKFISPHYMDMDMPKRDRFNRGSCMNCHNPHGSSSDFDMLTDTYLGVDGEIDATWPSNYALCLNCHSESGPCSTIANAYIAAYYNRSVNTDDTAGHQFRGSSKSIEGSLPTHIRRGDKMPCYDCHNPHGSRGNSGSAPNTNLISDQRREWSGLTDTIKDPEQNRMFCLGCHRASDEMTRKTVEGVRMARIPNSVPEHRSSATKSCYDCHADLNPYQKRTSHNVHHPLVPPPP